MQPAVIHPLARGPVAWNVGDYDGARRSFRWDDAAAELIGPRGLNIAEVTVDRRRRDLRRPNAARAALAAPSVWTGLERDLHDVGAMTITMGQLVSTLFDAYDRSLHDEHLAAVATQVHIAELLERRTRARRTRTRKAA
jgi:hypothetical protein